MPLTLRLTDHSLPQAWILADASPNNDGVMTAAQAAQLAALVAGGGGGGLPPQGGNAGKFLETDGTHASWQRLGARAVVDLGAPYSNSTTNPSPVLTLNITTSGGDLLLMFSGTAGVTTNSDPSTAGAGIGELDLLLDGGFLGSVAFTNASNAGTGATLVGVALQRLVLSVAAGSHTVLVQGSLFTPVGVSGSIDIDTNQFGDLQLQALEVK